MTSRLADYIETGKAFDPDEREIAALALQHIDETEQAEVDAAWDSEVSRRIDEIVNGDVELVSSEETFAVAREMLVRWRAE